MKRPNSITCWPNKWKTLIITLIIASSIPSATGQTALSPAIAEYEITVNESDPFKVLVKAEFNSYHDTLSVHPSCPNYDYPEGWSTFIKPITSGLNYLESAKWSVQNKKVIEYEIDLSFVQKKWDVGNEQAGTYINEAMFLVTKSLFLTPKSEGAYTVKFNLPQGYTITAPWKSLDENTFYVKSKEQLINNTLVWGRHITRTIHKKQFTLNFVLLNAGEAKSKMVSSVFDKILNSYLEIFPETPEANYLITLFSADQNDGEAYSNSNAFTLRTEISEGNKVIWANLFAHELFHFWNGRMINGPERAKRQWFSEGFTEYFSNMALVRNGIISEDEFFRNAEKTIALYFYFRNYQYPKISLAAAGTKKTKYRFGVYNAGWCAAFVLDMTIRSKDNEKTLSDFMNMLFIKYGLGQKEYTYENLATEIQPFLNKNNLDFLDRFISGLELLPVEKHFSDMGLIIDYTSYDGTAFIFKAPKSTKEQDQLRKQWLSNN